MTQSDEFDIRYITDYLENCKKVYINPFHKYSPINLVKKVLKDKIRLQTIANLFLNDKKIQYIQFCIPTGKVYNSVYICKREEFLEKYKGLFENYETLEKDIDIQQHPKDLWWQKRIDDMLQSLEKVNVNSEIQEMNPTDINQNTEIKTKSENTNSVENSGLLADINQNTESRSTLYHFYEKEDKNKNTQVASKMGNKTKIILEEKDAQTISPKKLITEIEESELKAALAESWRESLLIKETKENLDDFFIYEDGSEGSDSEEDYLSDTSGDNLF